MQDWAAVWSGAEWRAEATAWIEEELGRAAYRITGAIEQPRVRFWSTQLTIPTDHGRVWFKTNNPGQAFEARLVETLARLVPDRVVTPIAIDPDRGWLLSPDQGGTLREKDGGSPADWERVLGEYGALQRGLVPHESAVRASGVTPLPASETAAYLEQRLDDLAHLAPGDPRGLSIEQLTAARRALPKLRRACEDLDAVGIPNSLQHNDLHDNNAFLGQIDRPLRFFDFGDALWAPPLSVLRVPLDGMAHTLSCPADDPRVLRATDAYLDNWSDLASPTALRTAVPVARVVAGVHRALSWRRLLDEVPIEAVEPDWRDAESWWLTEYAGPDSSP